ncbi:MAG: ABC transporter permease [Pseudomonadota bacterium]
MVLSRLYAVMRKELLQLRRDRITFGMVVGIPIGQILLFGYAINTDVRGIEAAVSDQAQSHLSRQFTSELGQTQVLTLTPAAANSHELEERMRAGEISLGVVIPPDFDRRAVDPERPAAQLLVDGADPTILGVANQLVSMPVAFDAQAHASRAPNIEVRAYYNPERRTAVNIVPGLIGVILTMTMMLFTSVAIVRERERGNLELLINTPVTNLELMVGKLLPYVAIGLVQLALILLVGRWLFDVPIRGEIAQLYLAAALFIAANLALGLLISSVARTQFQAMQVTVFVLLPSILLSGFMFPFAGMPKFAQYLGELLPNTHFIRLTRGIMLRDASLVDLRLEVLALLLFTAVAIVFAMRRFSRRLD